jgi:hypothetical protein
MRSVGQRAVPGNREDGRRDGDHPVDAPRVLEPLLRLLLPAHRTQPPRPAQRRVVGDVRSRQRIEDVARLRRHRLRDHSLGRDEELRQRVSSRELPGNDLQGGHGPAGGVRESPRSRRPVAARQTRPHRPARPGRPGTVRFEHGARHGGEELRTCVSDAVRRPRTGRPLRRVAGDAIAVRTRPARDGEVRPLVSAGAAAGGTGGAVHSAHAPRHRQQPLGPARRPREGTPRKFARDRPPGCRPVARPESSRPARRHAGRLGGRIRTHALRGKLGKVQARPRPSSHGFQHADGRRGRARRHDLWSDRRTRNARGREPRARPRPPRHNPSLVGDRPRAAHVPSFRAATSG